MTRPLASVVVVIVFVLTFFSASTALGSARNQGLGLFDYGSKMLFSCSVQDVTDRKRVIIRIDEVQAFWQRDSAIRLAEEAEKYDAPVVFGIIPKNILEDKKLVMFLQRSRCLVETALNGWDYSAQIQDGISSVEFQRLEAEEAYLKIENGKKTLQKINGQYPTTFIPPYNIYSVGTALALKQADIPVVSSQGTWDYDYTVAPFISIEKEPMAIEEVLTRCAEKFVKKAPCVILFNPKDFSVASGDISEEKIKYFTTMLADLVKENVTFTTFDADSWQNGGK